MVRRNGEHSYRLELQPTRLQDAHRSQLTEHFMEDLGAPVKLFRYLQAPKNNMVEMEEWEVEQVKGHGLNAAGQVEFLIKWQGSQDETWNSLHKFFQKFTKAVMCYLWERISRAQSFWIRRRS